MSNFLRHPVVRVFLTVTLVVVMVIAIIFSIQLHKFTADVQSQYVSNYVSMYEQLEYAINTYNSDGSEFLVNRFLTIADSYAWSNFHLSPYLETVSPEAKSLTLLIHQAVNAAMDDFVNHKEISLDAMKQIELVRDECKAFLDYIDLESSPSYFSVRRRLTMYIGPSRP